jgi:PAS domain S-box-containing protein
MPPNETEPRTPGLDTAGIESSGSADARDAASGPIYVLHVDDEPEFADLVATFLERVDDRFVIHTRTAAEDGLEALQEAEYDCVVSDYDMPGTDGIEFLRAVRDRDPELPFVLYTGKGSEEVASDAISAGVTDYLQKESGTSQYDVLANRVLNAIERYRARQALASSQKRLSLLFEQSPLGVVEWDDDLRFARVNQAAEEILGYDADDLVGESWERVVPDSERESLEGVVSELTTASGGFHSIHEHVREDGERIICEWHNRVVTDDDGDVVARFTLFQDVTDREHQEATLRAREAEFRAITESATDAILTIDPDSVIRYANPSIERLFGYEPDELVGEPLTMLMPERLRERHRQALERYLETGERRLPWEEIEMTGLHRDGHELDLRVSFSELETRQGHRFTGIIRDTTAGAALLER